MSRGSARAVLFIAVLCAAACGEGDDGVESTVTPRVSYAATASFWDAPFPSPHRARADGTYDLSGFVAPGRNALVEQVVALASETKGYGLASPVYFPLDGAVDSATVTRETVLLVNVERGSPLYGRPVASDVAFKSTAETYSPANVIIVAPRAGEPLRPSESYAAFVTRRVRDVAGRSLRTAPVIASALAGSDDAGALGPAIAWAREGGLDVADVAALTVFRTADPFARVEKLRDAVASRPAPALTSPVLAETYDEFCVYTGRVPLPVYQRGPKPYTLAEEGGIALDAAGAPVAQSIDDAAFTLSLPRQAMPASGYPFVVYAAGGGGTSRQVVDRTQESANPDEGRGPRGRGPALHLARRGIASFGVAAPITADRNPRGEGGEAEFFNVGNMTAFRDNVVQSVLDLTAVLRALAAADVDASACPGVVAPSGRVRLDGAKSMFWGHSTGSTVGGVLLGLEPLRAAMLSGAGGTWIETLLHAESPVRYRTIVPILLGYAEDDELDAQDPALGFFQWAMDATDVTNWATRAAARHLLVLHGIRDTYHPPEIVGSYAAAAHLDVVTPVIDEPSADRPRAAGGKTLDPPAASPRLFVQREQAEGTDGHYIAFELDELKRVYACWFAGASEDAPVVVPSVADAAAPCR